MLRSKVYMWMNTCSPDRTSPHSHAYLHTYLLPHYNGTCKPTLLSYINGGSDFYADSDAALLGTGFNLILRPLAA
eukprot:8691562-Pyramimonas_sp.AAC.1